MGIMKSIKKRLPIVGGGDAAISPTPASRPASAQQAFTPPPAPQSPRGDTPVVDYISDLVARNEIVIFMKGSPQAPMCGFSANAAAMLTSLGRPVAHCDILLDPEVRQGIKDYSQWPTLPQIYIGGEFVGGSDILREMYQSGELQQLVDEAFAKGAEG